MDTSDDQLLRLLQRGDADALQNIYRRWQGPVQRFSYQMCGRADQAEEVVQEVFLALIHGYRELDPAKGALGAWLFGVARNQVLRRLEAGRRFEPLEDQFEPAVDGDTNVLDDLTQSENLAALRQAILALPPHYREVVALCDLEELSYEQAAITLQCAVGTVRSRLHRARNLLVEKLRPSVRCQA
jgi:RNA polymerase sigma-70 factor (ECF subfamily)